MAHFWVTFNGRAACTVNAATKNAAREFAEAEGVILEIHEIPYPRHPQLNDQGTPSFCYGKSECFGKTACPNRYACTE